MTFKKRKEYNLRQINLAILAIQAIGKAAPDRMLQDLYELERCVADDIAHI